MPSTTTRRNHQRQRLLSIVCFGFSVFVLLTVLRSDDHSNRQYYYDSYGLLFEEEEDGLSPSSTPVFSNNNNNKERKKLLYTVTTLVEYNNGRRNTVKDSDRFQEALIPVVSEGVRSMLDCGYDVDVYLICGFSLRPERRRLLEEALPSPVGLQVWDDAVPLHYEMRDIKQDISVVRAKLENHTRGLARQHRFVLKDKLPYYDVFVNFEDDMLIKGQHVDNYVRMSQHLQKLRDEAPDDDDDSDDDKKAARNNNNDDDSNDDDNDIYFGSLTKRQLQKIMPGFMRVEAVLDEAKTPIPPLAVKVPVDLDLMMNDAVHNSYNRDVNNQTTNSTSAILPSLLEDAASICCAVSDRIANPRLPQSPTMHQLVTWEVQILPLGVRQMPPLLQQQQLLNHYHHHSTGLLLEDGTANHNNSSSTSTSTSTTITNTNNNNYTLDWVVLQRGTEKPHALTDYWSGNDGYYRNDTVKWRPVTSERKYINNQGGYMATRWQLLQWHFEICPQSRQKGGGRDGGGGGFLPPFDGKNYANRDGLDSRDVEYWSGGLQLVINCGLQRIINLDPYHFPSHILYHTPNNKQAQLQHVKERFTRLDELYGMLNTVRKNAERRQTTTLFMKNHNHLSTAAAAAISFSPGTNTTTSFVKTPQQVATTIRR